MGWYQYVTDRKGSDQMTGCLVIFVALGIITSFLLTKCDDKRDKEKVVPGVESKIDSLERKKAERIFMEQGYTSVRILPELPPGLLILLSDQCYLLI